MTSFFFCVMRILVCCFVPCGFFVGCAFGVCTWGRGGNARIVVYCYFSKSISVYFACVGFVDDALVELLQEFGFEFFVGARGVDVIAKVVEDVWVIGIIKLYVLVCVVDV